MVKLRGTGSRLRAGLILFALAAFTSAAQPEDTFRPSVKFCNRTLNNVNLAMSYDLAGSTRSTSVGWFGVKGCTCRTVLQNTPLRATEIFLFAHRGIGTPNLLQPAKGNTCIKDGAFKLNNETANANACAAAKGRWVPFRWYDTKGVPLIVNLRQANQCNLMGD